jgi:autotransporter-associated beta strand protein
MFAAGKRRAMHVAGTWVWRSLEGVLNPALASRRACPGGINPPARRVLKPLLVIPVMAAMASAVLLSSGDEAAAQQRVLGVDISYWNCGTSSTGISQANWNTAYNTPNANGYTRHFAWIRATRGGTTGLSQTSGTPSPHNSLETLSRRYDDSRFLQNITRATKAGFMAAPYHYGRPSIAGNTGTDEANHFIEMAGIFMRPGYLMPVFDLEDGTSSNALATFSIDFSNRIYNVLGIRPAMYINGNHTSHLVNSGTAAQMATIAQPQPQTPSVVGPAFPMLWNARYSDNTNPESIPIQTGEPKHTYTTVNSYYGPWDDYGDSEPWSFWQFSSTTNVPGFNAVDTGIDSNVAHGDIEYVRNYLIPAVWMNNSSGDWSTLANWNSGQPVTVPVQGDGQAPAYSYDASAIPVPRLPGANSGMGATHGQYDTVILERPSANITVTHSTGTTNVRKLYVRETLEITGGSFTINYDPTYRLNNNSEVRHGGPISAQFSGSVTLSGTGSLSVHTLQIDSAQTFTLGGGTLTFNKINLISNSATKIAVTGNVAINPLNNATATITRSASNGTLDLGGGTRTITVGNGTSDVDLDVVVPIANGGLTKNGAGTMRLSGSNTFTGPVTINGGVLRSNHNAGFSSSSVITVNNGGTLDMNGMSDTIAGLASTAGHTTGIVNRGSASLTLSSTSGSHTFHGTITGTGTLIKSGAYEQFLAGNHSLGPVSVTGGALYFMDGSSTTGAVTVSNAAFGGTGSVSGAVTVNSGGHVQPGTTLQPLGVGALTLNTGSVLDIGIGSGGLTSLINVAGLLTLNAGSVNLFDAGGMGPGTYTIIDYGTRSGDVLNLGTPSGPEGFNYSLVDTGSTIDLAVTPIGVSGDFNNDGIVDARDYVVWRKNHNTTNELPNDDGMGGVVGENHYELWRANFGSTLEGNGGAAGAVPEPSTAALLILATISLLAGRRGRKR